jgi:hypothetical protein
MRRRKMPGRESEYTRGYISGVAAMMGLVASGRVKKLDKTNVLHYAIHITNEQKEREANAIR